jgi:putative phosphoribosyl transferase
MPTTAAPPNSPTTRVVHIAAAAGCLTAELTVPAAPRGIVVFARTNAARRQTRHDRELAAKLHDARLGTLAFDLLTPSEELIDEATCSLRVDLALLARRLIEAIDWLAEQPSTCGLDVGLLGEGPGAAAAFVAACVRPAAVAAIVVSVGRLDQAQPVLSRVRAPSLIIVSGNDETELRSNDMAFRRLRCSKELVRVSFGSATTPDTNREISRLAVDWFSRTMAPTLAFSVDADDVC